jgi:uncharacterized surface protein with fasciclin (FAS1) repeats
MTQLSQLQCTLVKIVFAQLIGNEDLFHESVDLFHEQEGYVMEDEVNEALRHAALQIDNMPAGAFLDMFRTISAIMAEKSTLSYMRTLLLRDTEVLMMLNNKKAALTLFVPTDTAFANYFSIPLAKQQGRKQESFADLVRGTDPREAIALVRRHIATGRVPSFKAMKIGSSFTVRMASADIFIVSRESKTKWIVNNGNKKMANITERFNANNGKLIVIDQVFRFGDSQKERLVYGQPPPRPNIVYEQLPPITESPYGQLPRFRDEETVYGTMPEKPELVYVDLRPEVIYSNLP